ncbi:uncharacterized protein LOC143281291 [Babylonia areolata]|uniref:uncharacterized protein LOC143281291 n=1 Tax=Babylonia areolata TaxID=304850 RepID=UPI003FD4FB28
MNLPTLFKVAFGLVALSLILFLAGFASNFWMKSTRGYGYHFGLWAICFPHSRGCLSYGNSGSATPAHAYAARFLTIYQLIAVIVGIVLLCLFAFKSPRQSWAKSGYSLLLSAGILGFVGAVIFIGREKSLDYYGYVSVSWSGILVIFAGIIQVVSAVLIILPIRRGEVEFEQV